MTQLITQQRVIKRQNRPKKSFGNFPAVIAGIRIRLMRFMRRRYLYLCGIAAGLVLLFFVASSVINHNQRGIGGGLGDLPKDLGLDSLLDSYLSPGKSPESEADYIVPTGKVLMSYQPATYVVERGDTVSEIALKFGLRESTIISINGIKDVRRLQAGVELNIPPIDGVMHVVKGHESLSAIAKNYGVELTPILDINNIDSTIIHEGDKLFVPDAAMSYVAYHKAIGDLFVWPLRGILSSGYAMRTDPFTGFRTMHHGYDIVGKVGATIVASNKGTIMYTGESNLYGKYVLIRHEGGYQTLYAHLSKWSVSQGQRVAQKQKIGEVGSTGRSTGPHLHFSIYHNGDALDPGNHLYY